MLFIICITLSIICIVILLNNVAKNNCEIIHPRDDYFNHNMNKYIDVRYINCSHHTDRDMNMRRELNKISNLTCINTIKRIDAVTSTHANENVVSCCTKSHIKSMKSIEAEWVLILEDDVIIDAHLFNETVKTIQSVMDTGKSQIFYFGTSSIVYPYLHYNSNQEILLVKKKNRVIAGGFAYLVNRKFISRCVSCINTDVAIDMQLSSFGDPICCIPTNQLDTQTYYRLVIGSGCIRTKNNDTTLNLEWKNKIKKCDTEEVGFFIFTNRYLYGIIDFLAAIYFSKFRTF